MFIHYLIVLLNLYLNTIMIYRFNLIFLAFLSFIISDQKNIDIIGFLKQIQSNPRIIPQTKIKGAVITIVDKEKVTMKIRCDSLSIVDSNQNSSNPTILEGRVRAIFYDENQDSISVLQSDMAEYVENYSLVAKNNIIVYNVQTKDSLFFNDEESEIEWNDMLKKIQSNDEFILKNQDECTTGTSFYSNVDLTDMKISNPKGSNQCE